MTERKSSILIAVQISGSLILLIRKADTTMKIELTSKPIKPSSCLQQRPKREQLSCGTVSCNNRKAALSCTIQADKSFQYLIFNLLRERQDSKCVMYLLKMETSCSVLKWTFLF